jgi:hypothetical protein
MRLLASISSSVVVLLLTLVIPSSLAGYGPRHPQLRNEKRRTTEGRSFFGSLVSLFGKRDECGTQYGPTYVDCGARGCYQPTLGQICCGSEGGMFPVPVHTSLFYLCECLHGYIVTEEMIITMSVVRLLRCRQLLLGFELLPKRTCLASPCPQPSFILEPTTISISGISNIILPYSYHNRDCPTPVAILAQTVRPMCRTTTPLPLRPSQ